MARRAVWLLTLLGALWLVPGTCAAEQTVLAPTFFNVDGGSVTTPALAAGTTYRLDVGGTFQEVGPNITFDHDAAYCYDDNASMPICRGDESLSKTGLWARYQGGDAKPYYDLFSAAAPAYAASHRYDLTFVAKQSVPLTFLANTPEVGRDYPGQLGVALYAEPATCTTRGAGAHVASCGEEEEETFVTPLSHKPTPGELVSYRPPPPGEAVQAQGPKIPVATKQVTVKSDSTRSEELAAISGDNANDALIMCAYFAQQVEIAEAVGISSFAQTGHCLRAVLLVLKRCDELKRRRGGPASAAAPLPRPARARPAALPGCCHSPAAQRA